MDRRPGQHPGILFVEGNLQAPPLAELLHEHAEQALQLASEKREHSLAPRRKSCPTIFQHIRHKHKRIKLQSILFLINPMFYTYKYQKKIIINAQRIIGEDLVSVTKVINKTKVLPGPTPRPRASSASSPATTATSRCPARSQIPA